MSASYRKVRTYNYCPLILALVLVIISTACWQNSADVSFRKLIPTENINDKISLTLPSFFNQEPVLGCMDLLVTNNSSSLIRFPLDFGIRLFIRMENGWNEIENLEKNYNVYIEGMDLESSKKYIEEQGGLPLSSKENAKGNDRPINFCPDLSGYKLPLNVRVVVVGTIFKDDQNTNEKVAAFYDVNFER